MTRDGYGAEVPTWVTKATIWCLIEPIAGREFFASAQIQSEVMHKVTMRYRKGVKASDRIKWGDRLFDIRSVINTKEQQRELVCICREFTT